MSKIPENQLNPAEVIKILLDQYSLGDKRLALTGDQERYWERLIQRLAGVERWENNNGYDQSGKIVWVATKNEHTEKMSRTVITDVISLKEPNSEGQMITSVQMYCARTRESFINGIVHVQVYGAGHDDGENFSIEMRQRKAD